MHLLVHLDGIRLLMLIVLMILGLLMMIIEELLMTRIQSRVGGVVPPNDVVESRAKSATGCRGKWLLNRWCFFRLYSDAVYFRMEHTRSWTRAIQSFSSRKARYNAESIKMP